MGGIKRHPALQPFSRDHLIGLFHAHKLIKLQTSVTPELLDDVVAAFSQAWHQEISVHFADEDRLIGSMPIKKSSLKRLHDEHVELSEAIEALLQKPHSALNAVQVGQLLDKHIRWEEHTLFPEIETTLSVQALTELAEKTQLIEKSRRRKL